MSTEYIWNTNLDNAEVPGHYLPHLFTLDVENKFISILGEIYTVRNKKTNSLDVDLFISSNIGGSYVIVSDMMGSSSTSFVHLGVSDHEEQKLAIKLYRCEVHLIPNIYYCTGN